MAIKDNQQQHSTSNAGQQTSMGQSFEQAREAQQTRGAGDQRDNVFSFRSMGNMTRTPMGRTPASEVLSKLVKALSAVYEEGADKSFEVACIPVDMNSTTSLGVSALVVALRDKQDMSLGVAFHTLIVEASVEPVAPRFEVINGVNTEIVRSVGEAYDKIMISEISGVIAKAYPSSQQHPASACVVPRDFNINDQTAVYTLAANALFAASSELETSGPNFIDLNLANADRDSNLQVRVAFGNTQINNAVQQPVRNDVAIDFTAAPNNQNQNAQQLSVERVSGISRLGGFIDLVWDPVQMAQAPIWGQAVQQNNYQRYSARFVATSLESQSVLTIPAQLLALIPALSLLENNQWVQAFRQNSFNAEADMHDIGAVGIEANFDGNPNGIGTRIDTKADSFRPEHLYKLISAVFRQGLHISLDVAECGPDTWFNDVFAAAAEGNPRANQAIIDAAQTLTNGNFLKYFPGGPVAKDDNNRIQLGHYGDRNGVRRDIRDIDYLAILNLVGEKDMEVVQKWSDSFLLVNRPLPLRLADRKRIITGIFSDVVFTGFARRVTFEPSFIEALAKGAADAGMVIRPVTSYADMGNYERAVAGFNGAALMNSGGVFSHAFGQTSRPYGNGSTFGNRSNW